MSETEIQMIEICQEIGGVAESNCHFTGGLAQRIDGLDNGDNPLLNMTIEEFLALVRQYRETFNRIHS